MKTLSEVWEKLEKSSYLKVNAIQCLASKELLFRTYIGIEGIPARRYVNFELPHKYINEIKDIHIPKGLIIKIWKSGQEKEGFISCTLEASESDVNDVFTIVLQDVIEAVIKEKSEEGYLRVLKERIDKWVDFFKKFKQTIMSKSAVIGLLGELNFILEMYRRGCSDVDLIWNGPRMAEQDFQADNIAVEIKTTTANAINKITISSLEQLDSRNKERLFLCCFRIRENDSSGLTLPMMIENVKKIIPDSRKSLFEAKLICLGYSDESKDKYNKKYSFCETKVYDVNNEFPKIIRRNIDDKVENVVYSINLKSCDKFVVDLDEIKKILME